jgi:hypothetical protein
VYQEKSGNPDSNLPNSACGIVNRNQISHDYQTIHLCEVFV